MTFAFEPARFTPAPLQTEGMIRFTGPADAVFDRISDHAGMIDWVPLLRTVKVTHPQPLLPGESMVGTARILSLRGGVTVREEVVNWDPKRSYAYTAEGRHWPLSNYVGFMGVHAISGGGIFTFREYFGIDGIIKRTLVLPGILILGRRALRSLSELIGGTDVNIRHVSATTPVTPT